MIYRHVLPGVHPRHWNRIDRLVEQVPRAFWKLLRNRSNAALPTIIEDFLCETEEQRPESVQNQIKTPHFKANIQCRKIWGQGQSDQAIKLFHITPYVNNL